MFCLIPEKHNEKRIMLMLFLFLVLDESIPGWCPNFFKLGGLPNCVCKPRKPVLLGAILKNDSEHNTCTIVHDDVFQNP